MIKYEDECTGCRESGMPCRGISCRNRCVKRLYCDECGEDSDRLYIYDGQQICHECLLGMFDVIEGSESDEQL